MVARALSGSLAPSAAAKPNRFRPVIVSIRKRSSPAPLTPRPRVGVLTATVSRRPDASVSAHPRATGPVRSTLHSAVAILPVRRASPVPPGRAVKPVLAQESSQAGQEGRGQGPDRGAEAQGGMAHRPLPCPDPSAPVAGRSAVEAAVDRRRGGLWRLPAFATNADRRLFHKVRHVRALMDIMPRGGLDCLLGGEASAQVASPQERAELARLRIEEKAGPEGENAAKGARFLGLLAERAERTGLAAGGLPAGACLVASIVLREARRAQQGGGTSQGGRTVGGFH